MKRKIIIIAIFAGIALAAAVPLVVFYSRPPVLVVADMSFIQLYGSSRARRENFRSSLSLFRPVKTVAIADDSGDDIVQFAIAEISSRPLCVVFPQRFLGAARLYREQNPEISVILLEGRLTGRTNSDLNDIFVYKTDIEADFLRVGITAALIDGEKNGKIAVFVENRLQRQCREAFLSAFEGLEEPPVPSFFTSYSQYSEISELSCVVLVGIGTEYMENFSGIPVVFFSWIDPSMLPNDVVLVVDDSPWAQVREAVRMAAAGSGQGAIRSNFLIINEKKLDSQALRKIKKQGKINKMAPDDLTNGP
jgi:hypothetical protein